LLADKKGEKNTPPYPQKFPMPRNIIDEKEADPKAVLGGR
jgi:hypothetical protein